VNDDEDEPPISPNEDSVEMSILAKLNHLSETRLFSAFVNASSLQSELTMQKFNYTIFAPTDVALRVFLTSNPTANTDMDRLERMVSRHSIKQDVLTITDLEDQALEFDRRETFDTNVTKHIYSLDLLGNLMINRLSRVQRSDIHCKDGIIHVVDTVVISSEDALKLPRVRAPVDVYNDISSKESRKKGKMNYKNAKYKERYLKYKEREERETQEELERRQRPQLGTMMFLLPQVLLRWYSNSQSSVINGTMPGDYGFDPLGIANTHERLYRLRDIEVKHGRLAMLASIGWPASELFHEPLRKMFGLPSSLLGSGGQAPTVFNGGLLIGSNAVGLGIFVVFVSALEYITFRNRDRSEKEFAAGDYFFDPLNFYELFGRRPSDKRKMQRREVNNGRLAMASLVVYVLTELLSGKPIVDVTPMFFRPAWELFHITIGGDPAVTIETFSRHF
jgi:uncharacterized surface protein with fasciclin (FAS1) repeats